MKRTLAIVLTLVLALAVVACGGGGSNIVGKWTPVMTEEQKEVVEQLGVEVTQIMEFMSNGTYKAYMDVKGESTLPFDPDEVSFEGTYKTEGDKLTVSMTEGEKTESFTGTYKIEGDKLTIEVTDTSAASISDGKLELTRVK